MNWYCSKRREAGNEKKVFGNGLPDGLGNGCRTDGATTGGKIGG